ncbi:hypothetical protein HPB50_014284 [Hyalomma asiaticum]|uniref:Uncharacterized protein n=1 Tax=Hyalomma asiaticum TaxID=266040 RepID=A0ACB7TKU0_HYAAI|nr:hypothetical protein HPB50_014284 [Hyalomma asiaticum]
MLTLSHSSSLAQTPQAKMQQRHMQTTPTVKFPRQLPCSNPASKVAAETHAGKRQEVMAPVLSFTRFLSRTLKKASSTPRIAAFTAGVSARSSRKRLKEYRLCRLGPGDAVWARKFGDGEKWLPGTIKELNCARMMIIQTLAGLLERHMN